MSTPTRRKVYKDYWRASANGEVKPVIPYHTLRRWRLQGKCDDETLRQLGMSIKWRKKGRTKTQDTSSTAVQQGLQILTPASSFEIDNEAPATSTSLPPAEALDNIQFLDIEAPHTYASVSHSTPPEVLENIQSVDDSDEDTVLICNSSDSENGLMSSQDSRVSLDDVSSSDSADECNSGNDNMSRIVTSKTIGVEVLNQLLHPSLKVTKFETLLMIMHLSMRHGMTDVFIDDMLKFVNQLIGHDYSLRVSKYLFNKLFSSGSAALMHFYCPNCSDYLGMESTFPSGSVLCEKCEWVGTVSSHNEGNYFLSLSIREQIREVLSRPNVKFVSKIREESVISDMMDGIMYRSLRREGNVLANPNALTITFNTDGAPVFNDGCGSIWPLHFFINELDLSQRFNTDNMLLAGLWFGKSKANVQLLLRPFVDELKELQKRGVVWKKSDGTVVESPVYAVCCCTDSVAKPEVQNHHQFNGAYGCGYCEHPNEEVTVVEEIKKHSGLLVGRRSGQEVHDLENLNRDEQGPRQVVYRTKKFHRYLRGEHKMRTNRELREYMYLARVSNMRYDHIMGSKGESVLCDLNYFNVVYMFCIDYMHAVLLGNVKKMTNLWFDSTSDGKAYYIGRKIGIVDSRLLAITLPTGFRKPRLMSHRAHWKANEFRSFLLYYALPVLDAVLPEQYFKHFRKLVSAIHTFTKEFIMDDELMEAKRLLSEWVYEYQELYGEFNMVYNVHLMTHLGDLVTHLGPLTINSAFVFESANGRLVKLAHGTTGVATQICRKHIMTKSVPKLLRWNYKASDEVIDFCCNTIGYRYLKHATKGLCNETLLGRPYYYTLTEMQQKAFKDHNLPDYRTVYAVNRAVIGGKLFHGRVNTRQRNACDSCVRLKTGEFALIDLIFHFPGEGLADVSLFVTKLNIASDPSPLMLPHIKECSIYHLGDLAVIKSTDIARKCIFYSCTDRYFVAEITNFYESD